MKIIGVIPARYKSSRFPGKPLADICGKPMIWWVYNQCTKVSEFDGVYVATDDERIENVCKEFEIPVVMTSENHQTHINRIHEVSNKIRADLYVVVCGDEPLIDSVTISAVIPKNFVEKGMYVGALMREVSEPTEVIDPANIKIATNKNDECIMLSRSPIPFPYKTILYKYKKIIGVECYNKEALDFFAFTSVGVIESIEDVTLQRFLENKIHIKFKLVETTALSVDTTRDLEKVIKVLEARNNL